jgi:adenylate cyclase
MDDAVDNGAMPEPERNEEFWTEYLSHPDSFMSAGRRFFSRLPADPRCRLCAAPFAGVGGFAMRLVGKRQSSANPNYCTSCEKVLIKHHGGAEVEGSMLFADIRGSTGLAEKMTPTEFRSLLDRFYSTASHVVFAHDGMVDKFVGDELVGIFPPMLSAERHAERAVKAAQELLRATGHNDPGGPWVPLGAGVHTGRAWFGAMGDGGHVELTVVGDPMNVTARLASRAEAGEILVSVEAAEKAGLNPSLARQTLELKGRHEPIEVVSLRVNAKEVAEVVS